LPPLPAVNIYLSISLARSTYTRREGAGEEETRALSIHIQEGRGWERRRAEWSEKARNRVFFSAK
jgi:hypothetical protein